MAVHDSSTSNNAARGGAATGQDTNYAQSNAGAAPRQPRPQVTMPVFGMPSQAQNFANGGEVFEKIYKYMVAQVKAFNESGSGTGKLFAVKMLTGLTKMNYSAIAIVRQLTGSASAKSICTVAHTMIIEKTGNYPTRRTETVGNVQYELVRTPGDAMDEDFARVIRANVSAATGVDESTVQLVDAVLVPNEFDAESESNLANLLSNSLNAVYVETEHLVNDYRGANITSLLAEAPTGKYQVSLSFNNDDSSYTDLVGMPIRQDVCVTLSFVLPNNGNRFSVHQADSETVIVRTYGYIDFEFSQPRPTLSGVMPTQKFVANFVITDIDSPMYAMSPDILMLGVASVATLNQDMDWTQAFRPTVARKNEIDYNDPGALNIEGNLANDPSGFDRVYDTKSKTVTSTELMTYIGLLCQPDMMVSIDLPKVGPKSYATAIFQWILLHSDVGAYTRMNDFLVHATNGVYVPPQSPMFFGVTNKVHGGYYRDKSVFRDLRHLSSYLSMANFVAATGQSPMLLRQYTDTMYASSMPSDLRATMRRKYIDDMSGKTAVYKQMYDRATFAAETLSAWIGALTRVGCAPIFANNTGGNDMFVRRATADFSGATLGQGVRFAGDAASPFARWGGNYGTYTRAW